MLLKLQLAPAPREGSDKVNVLPVEASIAVEPQTKFTLPIFAVRPLRVSVTITFETATVFGFVIVKFTVVVTVGRAIMLGLNDLVTVRAVNAG